MLTSLYENNKQEELTVFVMHSELNLAHEEVLKSQALKYGNQINLVNVDRKQMSNLPTRKQWPLVLYYRLWISELLPESINRILSLDIDIIVRKSLKNLYESNLEECYIAAAEDGINSPNYKKRLRMQINHVYFNAGVVLFNLKKIREDGVGYNTFLNVLNANNNNLTIPDQDLLNIVFSGKLKLLEKESYNCSPSNFEKLVGRKLLDEGQKASIVHYLRSDCKPWNSYVANFGTELGDLWWIYAKKTPFSEELVSEFKKKTSNGLINENLALKVYYEIALKWLQVENREGKLERYFLNRNWNKIAIYGLNVFQEILCSDIEKIEVKMLYLIDSYAKGSAFGYEVKNGSHFDDVDCIIVAACAHFNEIRSSLDDACPVISIDEVITEIYKM